MTKSITTIKGLTPELKEAVKWLLEEEQGCVTLELDDTLAVCVGWSNGFEEDDPCEIHSKSNPSWCIRAGIKAYNSDSMRTDYEWINFPFYDDGSVEDTEVGFQFGYEDAARELLQIYRNLKKYEIEPDGRIVRNRRDKWDTILTQANNTHRLKVLDYTRDGNKFVFRCLGYEDLFILRFNTTFEKRPTDWGKEMVSLYIDSIDIESSQIPENRLREILTSNYMIWDQGKYKLEEKLWEDKIIRYCENGNDMEFVK